MDFTESIREWVSIDNKIKKYQDEVKKERVIRNALTASILEQAAASKYGNMLLLKLLMVN